MKFTAEHEALRRTARQFVENELNPNIPEWEAAGRFRSMMYLRKWQI
jgi:citronellyl-CoA dehydrogenase